jgi:uncharacterized Zn-finger protein
MKTNNQKIIIRCTGHGSAAFGCGEDYSVQRLEISDAIYAICPYCGTATDLEKTYQEPCPKNQLFRRFGL